MNTLSISLTYALVDIKSELLKTLTPASPGASAGVCRIPVANGRPERVSVRREARPGRVDEWRVRCDLPPVDGGADDMLAYAGVLTRAAMAARILNSERAVSVRFIQSESRPGDQVQLFSQTEARGVSYRFGPRQAGPAGRPGYSWGDNEFRFEILGAFTYLGDETREGQTRALLVQPAATSTMRLAA